MGTLWLHVLRDNQIACSRPLDVLPLSVGSGASCDLVLAAPDVPARAGVLKLGRNGLPEFLPEDGWGSELGPGKSTAVGPFTLAVTEARGGESGDARTVLDALLGLVPALWAEDAREARATEAILEALRGAFDAAWVAWLRLPAEGPPEVAASRGRRAPGQGDAVSRSILEKVREAGGPVRLGDVQGDPALAAAASVHVAVHSVIAAPLDEAGHEFVYLESPVEVRAFGDGDRDLLGRVAELVAGLSARAASHRNLEALHRLALDEGGTELVGSGPAMTAVVEQVGQVAGTEVTSLILGESGTGKELIARAIHRLSARAGKPFVAVNCMALPEHLVEGELFGHVKGAFSGAEAARVGRFELADGGTLFLDEVGELSPAVQVKLLRVLQERVLQRLGDSRDLPVDVRVVAATNADLEEKVAAGTFREDLFYRLSVFVIRVPPLRERVEDLPELLEAFLRHFNARMGKTLTKVHPDALALLRAHPWPGNIRELRNVVEQAFVRAAGPEITADVLAQGLTRRGAPVPAAAAPAGEPATWSLEDAKAAFEAAHIRRALRAEGGNMSRAARLLELSRAALYKKCGLHEIDPAGFRDDP